MTDDQPTLKPPVTEDLLKVILSICKTRRDEEDVVLTFTVLEESKSSFYEVLSDFFKSLQGLIVVTSADDSETKKPVKIFIKFKCSSQHITLAKLQQYISVLKQFCKDIK